MTGREKLRAMGIVPLGLAADEAAALVGVSVKAFRAGVKSGLYPQPMRTGTRRRVWNRLALETALGVKAGASDEIMGAINALRSSGAKR